MEKHMQKRMIVTSILLSTIFILSACKPAVPAATLQPTNVDSKPAATAQPAASAQSDTQPVKITGDFTYTNDFVVETYMVEQAVAMADMTGFVKRDKEYVTTTESQTLGFMQPDFDNNKATYWIQLPVQPEGDMNNVDPTGGSDKGVQIFAVSYWPNLAGGPYSEGDDPTLGWPNYLASVKTDTENKDEVIGGKLVIWSPDDKQQFPSGYGADGLLFTKDDPVTAVQHGYSVIDLDAKPFAISREAEPKITLYEPSDIALKDYSKDSYTTAFQKMFDVLKKEYAFNGIEGKAPDWEAVYTDVMPKVKAAEDAKDSTGFYLAIRDFTWAFNDGHVGASGGDMENEIFSSAVSSGYGFAVRVLDDGSVLTIYVTKGGPAEKAGVVVGDVLTKMGGKPVMEALLAVKPLSAPFSTDFSRIYQEARYLLRAPAGTETEFVFTKSDGKEKTVKVTSASEQQSYAVTSIYRGSDPNALPVEFKILESGVGYVKVNSNYDDLNLIIRLFSRALKTFKANEVPGIVIDLRQNSGGSPLSLAGFLYDKDIPLGQLEYYSELTGKFEPDGPREKVTPYLEQYSFNKMAVLVGQACASACEIEAYGFSQVPGMMVFGETPSAGVEAEVGRGQFSLPEGISLQAPTGRFTLPDGSIFLEGKGVQLTNPVPVNAENVLSGKDYILNAALNAILLPDGAGVVPIGAPTVTTAQEATVFIKSGAAKLLEDVASEQYDNPVTPGETYAYTIPLLKSEPLLWGFFWCAKDQTILEANFKQMKFAFSLDGKTPDPKNLATLDFPNQGQFCRVVSYQLTDWPAGEHHLSTTLTFLKKINDGMSDYDKGTFIYDYTVFVKP
jgi:C-terminal processing protease CtpA/Prc